MELSHRANLLNIDLATEPFSSPVQGSAQLQAKAPMGAVAAPGVHGVVVWADYVLPTPLHNTAGGAGIPPGALSSTPADAARGAGSSSVIENGPSPRAYSATQTVLLLPQHQRCAQLQGELGLHVAVRLEDHGFSLKAERVA